jgi:acyl carrier protein
MWDEGFDEILRPYLPFLSESEELTPETQLRDNGLDSLTMVELLARLEGTYQVRFVDDALRLETFETAGSLWAALQQLVGATA